MARSVTFNGITRFKPGGITKVNAEALNQIVSGENSIVALLGEADAGPPGSEGLVSISDTTALRDTFKNGPLVDAGRLAFSSSGDEDIPGGASQVFIYKTNNSTQAESVLPGMYSSSTLASSATGGSTTTLEDTDLNSGSSDWDHYGDDYFNGEYIVLKPHTTDQEVRRITDFTVSGTFTVDTAFSVAPTSGDDYEIFRGRPVVALTASTTINSSRTEITVDTPEDSFSSGDLEGRYIVVSASSGNFVRKIVSNNSSTSSMVLGLSRPLPSSLSTSEATLVSILSNSVVVKAVEYGNGGNGVSAFVDVSDDAPTTALAGFSVEAFTDTDSYTDSFDGPDPIIQVFYEGAESSDTDTVDSVGTVSGFGVLDVQLVTGGLSSNEYRGRQVKIGDQVTVVDSNDTSEITIRDVAEDITAGDSITFLDLSSNSRAFVEGDSGVATKFVVELYGSNGTKFSDSVEISISSTTTLRDLMNELKANNFEVSVRSGVDPDTYLAKNLDYNTGLSSNVVSDLESAVVAHSFFYPTLAITDSVSTVVNSSLQTNELVLFERASDLSVDGGAFFDLTFVDSSFDAVDLSGGSRGTSSNSDFQAGFDELLKIRVNSVVPLIDEDLTNEGHGSTATRASVAAQLLDHVIIARGASQGTAGERGGYIGVKGSKSDIISQANDLNDADVQLVGQNPTVLNASGSLEEFGPRMLATMAASMRAGVTEVAEPLTHKFLRVSGLDQDSSWDPRSLTDAREMITNGVLFAETIDGRGTRWVRDLTTYVKDDNLAFVEGSVRDAVRFVSYNLREQLVDRFTGKKAKPATIAAIKDTAATILEVMRQDSVIVDSTDPITGATVRAYHNLKVSSSGDIVRINVGIFPVPGINFQLNELFLQLPTQSA